MKGIKKAIIRTPQMLTTKVGLAKKSVDPEFDEYQRKFTSIEETVEKMLKDCKKFNESVVLMFSSGSAFSVHFAALFQPLGGEYDLIGKHPEAAATIRNAEGFKQALEDLSNAVAPELELIDSRIAGPTKEFQVIVKQIRKSITKRDHKLIDYDRFSSSLTKLRDKKEKTLNDEKNLFKLEQDFEAATTEYEYINAAMKSDLPRFMSLAVQYIEPLFQSLFYMQLNIYYLMLEKLNTFADGKYDVTGPIDQIVQDYVERRGDVAQEVESMQITRRIISTTKMVQANRAANGLAPGRPLGRSVSSASSTSGPSRAPPPPPPTSSSSFIKKGPPPPPPSSSFRAPPPYTPSARAVVPPSPQATSMVNAAVTKRPPPPPPPLKPKPRVVEPPVQYVVALFDFIPQADGDLGFRVGDRIEVVEKTTSSDDWWTGKLRGKQGVFPANYVQES